MQETAFLGHLIAVGQVRVWFKFGAGENTFRWLEFNYNYYIYLPAPAGAGWDGLHRGVLDDVLLIDHIIN